MNHEADQSTNHLKIERDNDNYSKLISQKLFLPGEVILNCDDESSIINLRSKRTIQISDELHLKNKYLDYINHSCEPNSVFHVPSYCFVALKEIQIGDEITFFYPGSETELKNSFSCNCKSHDCLGYIRGAFQISPDIMDIYIQNKCCTDYINRQVHSIQFVQGVI